MRGIGRRLTVTDLQDPKKTENLSNKVEVLSPIAAAALGSLAQR